MSKEIEYHIGCEEWDEARRLIEGRLIHEPHNHWLLTRLYVLRAVQLRKGARTVTAGIGNSPELPVGSVGLPWHFGHARPTAGGAGCVPGISKSGRD